MPTPINQPAPSFTVAASPAADSETVVCTVGGVIVDVPQYAVLLSGTIDITIVTPDVPITLKLKRGSTTSGTGVTNGNTWGPFTVVAASRYQFCFGGYDLPAAGQGLQYSLTVTVGSGAATSTVNGVSLSAEVTGLS